MESKAHALAAGLFTLLLGAALIAIVMWFGKREAQSVFYTMYTTGSVNGLKPDAPVRYRGVDVGRVTSIRLEPGGTGRIQLEIGIGADTPVTGGTYAQLGYQGITGIAYVQLNEDGKSKEALLADNGKPAQIRMKPSILDEGEALFNNIAALTEKLGGMFDTQSQNKMGNALAGIEDLARHAGNVAKTMQSATRDVPALVVETGQLARDARESLKRIDQIAGNADKLMTSASQLALKLDERMTTLDQIAATARDTGAMVRTVNEETVPKVNALVDELSRETRAVDRAVNRVVSTVVEQPQGFVFGTPPARPGPGEPGFNGGK